MSLFLDTSAILAIFDADDPRHPAAASAWTSVLASDEEIVTSNYVIVETITLMQSRFGVPTVRLFAEEMVPSLAVSWVNQTVHEAAVAAVLAGSGKDSPSLVDCVSFEVIRRQNVDRVFSYDKHFRVRGYDMLG